MGKFIAGALSALAVGALVLVCAVWLWPWHVEATRAPGSVELTLMRALLDRAVEREAPRVGNPYPPTPENLRAGMQLFRRGCAGCHGDGAQPSAWGSTSFSPRVPQFATQPPHRPEWQLYWIVKNGIRNTGMAAWQPLMTEEQIWKVAAFVGHIEALPEDVAAEWRQGR
jgi:mono/diheme cytochrome c family protein